MSKPNIPDGWYNLKNYATDLSNRFVYMPVNKKDYALDLMKRMAEALRSSLQYENCSMQGDNPMRKILEEWENWDA